MHDHQFGPHDFGGFGAFGPEHFWLSALLTGLSLLWWIAVPLLLFWVGSRMLGQRQPQPEPRLQPAGASASELLRQRYVMGEIDAATFEHMLERVMLSEAQERSGYPLIPHGVTRGDVGRVRIWEPADPPNGPATGNQQRDIPPPAPPGEIEIV